VLCGGSPCQDLSLAGLRAGLDGDRSGLFFEFARVADELVRPGGWIVFENVPGLLSSPGRDREIGVDRTGRDFAIVLATLADIGFHDLAWRVLDSRYFGVPQRRRRVYIVGRRAVGGSAREVLLEPESGGGNHQTSSQARPRVAASATSGSHSAGVSAPGRRQEDDENIAVLSLDRKGGGPDDNEAQAGHIVADPLVARSSRGRPQPLSAGHNTDGHIVSAIVRRYAKGTDSDATDALVVGTIRSHVRPGSNDIGGIVAHTLRAEGFDASEDGTGPPADANGVRAPAGLPGRVDDPQPDGPRYSAMGNAVTVNVLEWIGRRIVAQCERERVAA
jgi:DNA (cytosine-5)-methyltransferase 1